MLDALFDLDDYAPLTVKTMSCGGCAGFGRTLLGEPCPSCQGEGRLGSSIWRGGSCLARITAAVEVGSDRG